MVGVVEIWKDHITITKLNMLAATISLRQALCSRPPFLSRCRFKHDGLAVSTSTSVPKDASSKSKENEEAAISSSQSAHNEPKEKPQSMAEKDAQMRQALEGISGEGGEAGLELEDGQPTSMKRGVKNNMFRYI